jgi:hypothetical protein
MKKDNMGECAKAIPGLTNSPKETPNHKSIPNTVSASKEVKNTTIKNSILPPPKK